MCDSYNIPDKLFSNILLKSANKGDSTASLGSLFHCPFLLLVFLRVNLTDLLRFKPVASYSAFYRKGEELFSLVLVSALPIFEDCYHIPLIIPELLYTCTSSSPPWVSLLTCSQHDLRTETLHAFRHSDEKPPF